MVKLKYSGQVKVCSCRFFFFFLKSFHVIVCILPAKTCYHRQDWIQWEAALVSQSAVKNGCCCLHSESPLRVCTHWAWVCADTNDECVTVIITSWLRVCVCVCADIIHLERMQSRRGQHRSPGCDSVDRDKGYSSLHSFFFLSSM